MYQTEALLDNLFDLGLCYFELGEHENARETLTVALKITEALCGREDALPPLDERRRGDVCALLAKLDGTWRCD